MDIEGNKLILEPVFEVEQSELVLEGKLLVLRTKNPPPNIDLGELIEQLRDERIREVGGW